MRRTPSLTCLRAFATTARCGSLTLAARELCVTPAAVSHRIRDLEAELAVELFDRSGKGYRLTDAGTLGMSVIGDAFERLAEAYEVMRRNRIRRSLSLVASSSFAVHWILPRLAAFETLYPDIEVHLEAADEPLEPHQYRPDVIVTHASRPPGREDWDMLLHDDLIVVAAPRLAASLKPLNDVRDLLCQTLITIDWRSEYPPLSESWSRWFRSAGVRLRRDISGPHVAQAHLALQLAIEGRGLALVGSAVAERELEAGRLVKLSDHVLPAPAPYWISVMPARPASPDAKLLRDWLVAAACAPRTAPD